MATVWLLIPIARMLRFREISSAVKDTFAVDLQIAAILVDRIGSDPPAEGLYSFTVKFCSEK